MRSLFEPREEPFRLGKVRGRCVWSLFEVREEPFRLGKVLGECVWSLFELRQLIRPIATLIMVIVKLEG